MTKLQQLVLLTEEQRAEVEREIMEFEAEIDRILEEDSLNYMDLDEL